MGWNKRSFGLKGHKYTRGAVIRAPSTLTAAIDDTSGGIELTASEVSGADSYSYYYAIDGGDWQSAATGQTTSYTFVPTEAGEYSFGVSAVKGSTESRMRTLVPGSLFDDVSNEQGISLMAFAEATGVDAWTTDTNWLTDSTVGNWFGVTVSGGVVTAIDLSSNGLNGDVGTTLDDLTLTSLDLTGNTLTGKILIDPAPGTLYLATKDGEAMFSPSSGDYSGYAGALGDTDHKITFKDSADVEAVGYAAAAGGGETLGSELIGNGTFDTTDWWQEGVIDHIDTGLGKLVFDGTDNGTVWKFNFSNLCDPYALYKWGYVAENYVSGTLYLSLNGRVTPDKTASGTYSGYYTLNTTSNNEPIYFGTSGEGGNAEVDLDNLSLKKLTDIPATGLHLVSAEDGSTRNMASTGTGFDPNDIATIEIEALRAPQFTDVQPNESYALEDFYTATGGDTWTNNTGWDGNTAGDCYGVTVVGGSVTAIDLKGNNLVGAVGTTIDDFSDLLGNVDLRDNASLTSIPLWTYTVFSAPLTSDLSEKVSGNNLSITRAGDLIYLGADDVYHTAGVDEAAIGKHGLFHDGVGTNKEAYSEDFTATMWEPDPNITVDSNVTIAPDGTLSADRINTPVVGALFDNSFSETGDHTFSVFLKGEGSNVGKTISMENLGSVDGFKQVTLTDSWQRKEATAVDTDSIAVKRFSRDTATAALTWGAQLEQSPYASSYIPTSGAPATRATQAADAAGNGVDITLANCNSRVSAALSSDNTHLLRWIPKAAYSDISAGTYGLIGYNDEAGSGVYFDGSGNIVFADGTNTISHSAQWSADDVIDIAVVCSGSDVTVRTSVNGAAWTETAGSYDGAIPAIDTLRYGFSLEIPCWFEQSEVYDKALTDTEIENEVATW